MNIILVWGGSEAAGIISFVCWRITQPTLYLDVTNDLVRKVLNTKKNALPAFRRDTERNA